MRGPILIYGSYGYIGTLVVERAVSEGLEPVLGGRSTGPLDAQATEYGLGDRAFSLEYPSVVDRHLEEVETVLNCAGPYSATAIPMVEACLRTETNYVDLTGRVDILEALADRDEAAGEAGVTILPAAGFDVVPSDCLVVDLASRIEDPVRLRLALDGVSRVSPGTAKSIIRGLDRPGVVRTDGRLRDVPPAWGVREFPFRAGTRRGVTVPWGDLSTAHRSIGVPNIESYVTLSGPAIAGMRLGGRLTDLFATPIVQDLLVSAVDAFVSGPTAAERADARTSIYAELEGASDDRVAAELETPDMYELAAATAVDVARRVHAGDVGTGFETPASAFGPNYILEFEDVTRYTVDAGSQVVE